MLGGKGLERQTGPHRFQAVRSHHLLSVPGPQAASLWCGVVLAHVLAAGRPGAVSTLCPHGWGAWSHPP